MEMRDKPIGGETPFTASDFRSILKNHLKGVVFLPQVYSEGDLKRAIDKDSDLDPFNPSTYNIKKIKQYEIFINSKQTEDEQARVFIRQILNLKTDISLGETKEKILSGQAKKMADEAKVRKELEAEKFFDENRSEVLATLLKYK